MYVTVMAAYTTKMKEHHNYKFYKATTTSNDS